MHRVSSYYPQRKPRGPYDAGPKEPPSKRKRVTSLEDVRARAEPRATTTVQEGQLGGTTLKTQKKRGQPRKNLVKKPTGKHGARPADQPTIPEAFARAKTGREDDLEEDEATARALRAARQQELIVGGPPDPVLDNYFTSKGLGAKRKAKGFAERDGLLDEQELRVAISSLSPKHVAEVGALQCSYRERHAGWHFRLSCGFSLLFFGFGSKRALLHDFATQQLQDGAVVVVNGYLPTVSMRQVLRTVAEALQAHRPPLPRKPAPRAPTAPSPTSPTEAALLQMNEDDLLDLCSRLARSRPRRPSPSAASPPTAAPTAAPTAPPPVYVVVHNIDGQDLRSPEHQQTLALLAEMRPAVRMVASVDHINSPLLWDPYMAGAQFNWWWLHAPTFAPYSREVASLPLLLAPAGGDKGLRASLVVLKSLTPNARAVFRLLVSHGLEHSDDAGLTFHRLYTLCRERFLVSSEPTLRSHLREFSDHEMVRARRAADGTEVFQATLPADAARRLLQEMPDGH